jgi:transposase
MPAPYSPDLRHRVLYACAMVEGSRPEIARRFQVSERSVYLWLRQEREEGRTVPKPHAGGRPSRFDPTVIRAIHTEQPDVTLAECATRYAARTGVPISLSSVERLVQTLNLRRKKKDAPRR